MKGGSLSVCQRDTKGGDLPRLLSINKLLRDCRCTITSLLDESNSEELQ
jgi:hypothetical protein